MSPPRHLQLGDVVETLADTVGERVAVVAGERRLTYAELDERVTRLANHLAVHGIDRGDHVGIHAPNRLEWVESFYACFKLGAVPINVNHRYREQELRYLYDNSDCVAVVVAPEHRPVIDAIEDAFTDLRLVLEMGGDYETAIGAASGDRDFAERSADDIYMLYTGGTTGMPKGVMWRNEDYILGALNVARGNTPLASLDQLAEEVAANEPSSIMSVAPLMHGGCQWSMGNSHMVGGTFVLYCQPSFDPAAVLRIAAEERVGSLGIIGDATGKPIADLMLSGDAPDVDLSGLVAIANGAAPLTTAVRSRLREAFPDKFVIDGYGASETGATGSGMSTEGEERPRFTVGADTTVFIEDLSRPAAVDEVGLLARRGHIPLGYYKDDDKTAQTFPTIDGTRWSVPGDFGRIEEDGAILLLGRGSGSINTGGEKVFPEEVEAALMHHPGVVDAVVVGTPHERWGQQVTALVSRIDIETTEEALRDHCRDLLADYKVPKTVVFVDVVPRTPVGKLDYKNAKIMALDAVGSEHG